MSRFKVGDKVRSTHDGHRIARGDIAEVRSSSMELVEYGRQLFDTDCFELVQDQPEHADIGKHIPAGYVFTDYRLPKTGERFLSTDADHGITRARWDFRTHRHIIIEPVVSSAEQVRRDNIRALKQQIADAQAVHASERATHDRRLASLREEICALQRNA